MVSRKRLFARDELLRNFLVATQDPSSVNPKSCMVDSMTMRYFAIGKKEVIVPIYSHIPKQKKAIKSLIGKLGKWGYSNPAFIFYKNPTGDLNLKEDFFRPAQDVEKGFDEMCNNSLNYYRLTEEGRGKLRRMISLTDEEDYIQSIRSGDLRFFSPSLREEPSISGVEGKLVRHIIEPVIFDYSYLPDEEIIKRKISKLDYEGLSHEQAVRRRREELRVQAKDIFYWDPDKKLESTALQIVRDGRVKAMTE